MHNKVKKLLESYVLGDLSVLESARVEEHLAKCEQCDREVEKLEVLLESVGALHELQVDEHLCESAKKSLFSSIKAEERKAPIPMVRTRLAWTWRIAMRNRFAQFVSVTAVVLVVVLGIALVERQSGVAWGSLVETISRIPTYKFQVRSTQRFHMDQLIEMAGEEGEAFSRFMPTPKEGEPSGHEVTSNTVVYYSEEHGLTKIEDFEIFSLALHFSSMDNALTIVYPDINKYSRQFFSQDQFSAIMAQSDPANLIRELMSYEYTELGTYLLMGRKVEGIEVRDPRFAKDQFESCTAKLWVDMETHLPVFYELDGKSVLGAIETHVEYDMFEWDAGLGPEAFQPNLTNDYKLVAEIPKAPINEKTIVQAMGSFSELNNGRYPFNLAWTSVFSEIRKAYTLKGIEDLGFFRAMLFWQEEDFDWVSYTSLMSNMILTSVLYGQMVKEDTDVVYYGATVTPEDSDLPLLRWRTAEDKYSVIYGDLHVDTLDPLQLDALEGPMTE
jgi:hypothetical protein